ncbi:hypothetical protein EDD15DRAFT_2242771 [Pisolithus albus]|nr:hypothetical protein EDD15DRAFT_2242771 [Pisolithus albus]
MVSTRRSSHRRDDADDPAFSTLPAGLRRRIDEAFDTCAVSRKQASTPQNDNELAAAGGFIVDSATVHEDEEPGGFLVVFRNAASGWGAGNAGNDGVNRKDWRAICATLLEGEEGIALGSEETGVVEVEEDSGSEGDEYQMSVLSSEQEESSEEYHDDFCGTDKSIQATSEQRAICKEDFARFFPGAQLDGQRITAHEIMQAALLLKESLKPEEVG